MLAIFHSCRFRDRATKESMLFGIVLLPALVVLYIIAFHGECHSLRIRSGNQSYGYYTSRQYLFGKVIFERKWSEPTEAPKPPASSGYKGPSQHWRGFGILHKKTVYYE